MTNQSDNIPVLIVGGGPVGLTASLLLSNYDVPHILVERHPGTAYHPKAMAIMRRTAEIFRTLHVEDEIEELGLPEEWCKQIVWSDGLNGEILGRHSLCGEEFDHSEYSPNQPIRSPQTVTEAILFEKACQFEQADIRFSTELTSFTDKGNGVEAVIKDRLTDEESTITARYVIAADGYKSPTRDKLNIAYQGAPNLGRFIGIYHRADYGQIPPGRRAFATNILKDGKYAALQPVNGRDLWIMHLTLAAGENAQEYTIDRCRKVLADMTGVETDFEIISVGPWMMGAQTASDFSKGNIFLAGDAAHRTTPAGGLGMNTGIQSVHNLAWKVAAVLKGWASPKLLDTYETERRSIVEFNAGKSVKQATGVYSIFEMAANEDRTQLLEALQSQNKPGKRLGYDIGYFYEQGAFQPDDTPPPAISDRINDYVPTGRPGHRAPHVWLQNNADQISTIDLFSKSTLVLLAAAEADAWVTAAHSCAKSTGVPIMTCQIGDNQLLRDSDNTFEENYGISSGGAVLVRPDGFIAWRQQNAAGDNAEAELTAALEAICKS